MGPTIAPEMQAVIETLASLGGKPIETLSAQEARQQPTPADAVMKLMRDNNMPTPPVTADTMSRMVMPGVKVRIYTPAMPAVHCRWWCTTTAAAG
ncbi:hypothetical protein MUN84_10895 [Hymenobacter sp. 5516J-16]|uniref:hypothetical protein n=1 Tax=Hymenobacter sp. 5516J-16 TaxID=2932253 RepID=UPI001FD20546|nr:hypothetical protein [Hymenobacter sp. 5516J-16]UOQ78977.1 hypothetical protein MUN84_10895 [Hymenobacter sp. 5516J-16]